MSGTITVTGGLAVSSCTENVNEIADFPRIVPSMGGKKQYASVLTGIRCDSNGITGGIVVNADLPADSDRGTANVTVTADRNNFNQLRDSDNLTVSANGSAPFVLSAEAPLGAHRVDANLTVTFNRTSTTVDDGTTCYDASRSPSIPLGALNVHWCGDGKKITQIFADCNGPNGIHCSRKIDGPFDDGGMQAYDVSATWLESTQSPEQNVSFRVYADGSS